MTIRVVVVDDHPVFRDGLAALLRSADGLEVVDIASDAPQAIQTASAGGIDVVLMDLNLPSMSGVEATAQITAEPDCPAVLAVTMVDDDDTVVAALQSGARGYILKGATGEEIIAAVRTVAAGGAVFGAGVAARVLAATTAVTSYHAPHNDGLTDREREILALIADGQSNPQIARALGITLKTVQNYVSRILDKLQVADRTQAALKTRQDRNETGRR